MATEKQIQDLLLAITQMTQAISTESHQGSSTWFIQNFDQFDQKVESFKNYCTCIENHFTVQGITDDNQKAQHMLEYMGPAPHTMLITLASLKQVKELTYEEIKTLLQNHYCPKVNIVNGGYAHILQRPHDHGSRY